MNSTADVVIIGAGPAGLQAAIHSSRKKAKVVLVGKSSDSAILKAEVENYLGIDLISGTDLINIGLNQAKNFGTKIIDGEIISLRKEENVFSAQIDNGDSILAKSIILAVGVSRKKLGIPGEKEYFGKGVSYCASCDAGFYKNKSVAVIGGSSEAGESAILLSKYADSVYWISANKTASEYVFNKVKGSDITLIESSPLRILGKEKVTALELDDGNILDVNGVFVVLGAKGSMELALDLDIMPDVDGRIPVNSECMTSLDGVYACGDVTGKPYQLARAVGQGCIAGENAAKYALR